MQLLTLFSWGYWGWGTSTHQLVQAVDAVEAARGFAPPLFVDIRISRAVRAPGFNGRAFEETVGSSRYRWMPDLGNLAVTEGGDERIRIKNPAAAAMLLGIAEGASKANRRVIFFCSCEQPGNHEDETCCHRARVASLVLEEAHRQNLATCVAEWPGGEPAATALEITLEQPNFEKLRRGAMSIPLAEPIALADMAGLPWGTTVWVHCRGKSDDDSLRLLSGPARYGRTGWQLPILEEIDDEASPRDVEEQALSFRLESGYEVRDAANAISEREDSKLTLEAAPASTRLNAKPKTKARRARTAEQEEFMRPLTPSTALAAIVGSEPLVRTELTAKIWEHITEHNLQDAKNRKLIRCDEKLRAVTGKDAVTMLELVDFVSANLS